mmetsp:Transcript_25543/g.29466  ORF Transcript_25543/g.29466 Transcript_25543/m.29466 type:complete len:84 (-) Transcript_25543:556-807(-)
MFVLVFLFGKLTKQLSPQYNTHTIVPWMRETKKDERTFCFFYRKTETPPLSLQQKITTPTRLELSKTHNDDTVCFDRFGCFVL